jgi:hypothetical protein
MVVLSNFRYICFSLMRYGCQHGGRKSPQARERVQIIGRSGVFIVVRIDENLQAADLFPLHFRDIL